MNYEWYPGHMTAAIRMMREHLKLIDLVIETVDARLPTYSRNPDIDALCEGKLRLLVLNKADLADPGELSWWERRYRGEGLVVTALNAKDPGARKSLRSAVDAASRERRERNQRRGLKNQPIRALVAGIPNVGKSTVINLLAGRAAARTGNKPGVTRGKQWIQTDQGLQLLDSPGILWPRIGDPLVGEMLALIGSMNDDRLDVEALAAGAIAVMEHRYPGGIASRYGLEGVSMSDADGVLAAVAGRRGFLLEGGRADLPRAAALLVDDLRKGRLGAVVLEDRKGSVAEAEAEVEGA